MGQMIFAVFDSIFLAWNLEYVFPLHLYDIKGSNNLNLFRKDHLML